MDKSVHKEPEEDQIAEQASKWVWKVDQGLTAAEQDEFMDWMGASPRHGEIYRELGKQFKEFDELIDWQPIHGANPNPDLFAPAGEKVTRIYPMLSGIAALIAVVLGIMFWQANDKGGEHMDLVLSGGEMTLADDSVIHYNEGTKFEVDYSRAERRVVLKSGEAYFSVQKDQSRPFVVEAEGVELLAVGTAFNVRLGEGTLEVLIEEGIVEMSNWLSSKGEENVEKSEEPQSQLLNQFDRATVNLVSRDSLPELSTISESELKQEISWQHRLLVFNGHTLSDAVVEFNRLNDAQIVFEDAELGKLQISGTLMSDNILGLCRLLEVSFDVSNKSVDSDQVILFKDR